MKTFTQVAIAFAVGILLINFVRCSRERRAERITRAIVIQSNRFYNVETATAGQQSLAEVARRAATAGLALGLKHHDVGYEVLSNEIWEIYIGTNSP